MFSSIGMNSLPAKLDLTGAEISGELDEQNPPIHLPNQASDAPLLALDIGGSFIFLLITHVCYVLYANCG